MIHLMFEAGIVYSVDENYLFNNFQYYGYSIATLLKVADASVSASITICSSFIHYRYLLAAVSTRSYVIFLFQSGLHMHCDIRPVCMPLCTKCKLRLSHNKKIAATFFYSLRLGQSVTIFS